MAYWLKTVTIRTNNKTEGMKKIDAVWSDITTGRIPLLFDSEHNLLPGISPVSQYSNYESDENGDYDLCITGVTADFFGEMDQAVSAGRYKKYEEAGDDLGLCAKRAWERVWDEQKTGAVRRTYSADYESTVPAAYTKDGKAHCYLYIAIQ